MGGDNKMTEQVIRAKIETERKEMELLKETDYAAWVDLENDCNYDILSRQMVNC
jgi:hypothetical protein